MRSRLHARHYIPRLAESHLTSIIFRADYRGPTDAWASSIVIGDFPGNPRDGACKAAGFTVNEGHLGWKCDPRHGA